MVICENAKFRSRRCSFGMSFHEADMFCFFICSWNHYDLSEPAFRCSISLISFLLQELCFMELISVVEQGLRLNSRFP